MTVECLLQDRTGFLWVGTQDGLFQFDGRRFVRYGREEGLPSTRINVLHETADGRLWVGTRGGLAVRDGIRFRTFGPLDGVAAESVPDQGIVSDAAGTLFLASAGGLLVLANGKFVPDAPAASSRRPGFRASCEPFRSARLRREESDLPARGSGVEEIGGASPLPDSERIDETVTDGRGVLWARSAARLFSLGPDGTFVENQAGIPESVEYGRLALDERREVMLPTASGLMQKSGDAFRLLGAREGLASDTTLAALVDREGSLWIGLAGEGLAQRLGPGDFRAWGKAEGLAHDVVWSIARQKGAPSGSLFVGTLGGVTRLDPDGATQTWRKADGLSGDTVYALAAAEDGSVWAGAWPDGVTRFGPGRAGPHRYAAEGLGPGDFRVASLFAEEDGTVWAGTVVGAYRLAPGDTLFRRVSLPGGGERDTVYGFASSGGVLFAAGRYGLQRLTGSAQRRFAKADGLAADFVGSLAAASDGSLVVAYREALGAARVVVEGDRLTVTPLDAKRVLTFDKVLLAGCDAKGRIWLGGSEGVDVLGPDFARVAHFGRSDGLLSVDMSQNAFLAEPDGTVWLGTSRGLVRYRETAGRRAALPPPVVLVEGWAGSRRLDLSRSELVARGERDVTLSWTALTFLDPRRVRFRYRLAGLDDVYKETSMAEARFPALPSGSYTFEVAATSAAGVASTAPARFSFDVERAWWEEWGVRALFALALAGCVALFVRVRTAALERERRRLEEAVAARSQELATANRELSEASVTDLLTGLRNRRYFAASIDGDVAASRRVFTDPAGGPAPKNKDLIFFLVDIDRFKEVNDVFGHHSGDRVLVEVARRLQGVVRKSDSLVRWGGEEFLIISREGERDEARVLAERALAAISKEAFDLGDKRLLWRTCSVGWAPFPWLREKPDAVSYEDVLRLADRALYLAKSEGRHRAVGVLPLGTETGPPENIAAALKEPVLSGEKATVRVIRSIGPEAPA